MYITAAILALGDYEPNTRVIKRPDWPFGYSRRADGSLRSERVTDDAPMPSMAQLLLCERLFGVSGLEACITPEDLCANDWTVAALEPADAQAKSRAELYERMRTGNIGGIIGAMGGLTQLQAGTTTDDDDDTAFSDLFSTDEPYDGLAD